MSLLVLQPFVSGFRGNDDCFQKLPVTCSPHGSVRVADGCIARGIQLFVSDAGKFQLKGSAKKKPDRHGILAPRQQPSEPEGGVENQPV